MKFDYQNLASYNVIKAAENYYHSGRVELVKMQDDIITTKVKGSYYYTVKIWPYTDDLRCKCSCPYAEKGYMCKHVIASLLYIENDLYLESKDALKEIKDYLAKELIKLCNKHGDFIYRNASGLIICFQNIVAKINNIGSEKDKSEIVKYTITKLVNLNLPDDISEKILDMYTNILEKLLEENYYEMMNWYFCKVYQTRKGAYLKFFNRQISLADSIDKVTDLQKIISQNPRVYQISDEMKNKINNLKRKFCKPKDLINELRDELEETFSIDNLNFLISLYEDQNNMEEIYALLEKYKMILYLNEELLNKAIKYYSEAKMDRDLITLLKMAFNQNYSLEYYHKLKELTDSEEWDILKKELLEKTKANNKNIYLYLCFEEKLYDEVVDNIIYITNFEIIHECAEKMYNISVDNTYKIYKYAFVKHYTDRRQLLMESGIKEFKRAIKFINTQDFVNYLMNFFAVFYDSYYFMNNLENVIYECGFETENQDFQLFDLSEL